MSILSKIKFLETFVNFCVRTWNDLVSPEEERWAVIKGYGNKYHVSSKGKVYNAEGQFLVKTYVKQDGFERVTLYDYEGKTKEYRIHRLVAIYFLDNPENKKIVIHIDKDKHNNRVSNLKWK